MKHLIAERRPEGVAAKTRLGRIVGQLDTLSVKYDLNSPADAHHRLKGRGSIHVDAEDELVGCRISGEIFQPNPFEMAFHSFWLTRRGMILLVMGLLDEFREEKLMPNAAFIQTVHCRDREVIRQARQWLQRRQEKVTGNV